MAGVRKPTVGEKRPITRTPCEGVRRELIGSRMSAGGELRVPLTTDPLVHTKLRPSQARPKLVARPRLLNQNLFAITYNVVRM